MCNHNVLYCSYTYFTPQINRSKDRAVDKPQVKESGGQWFESQAEQMNIISLAIILPQNEWI